MVKVRTHNVRGIHHSSDGANAKKGCSHQHVAKICKSEIRRSKDRMTHTHKVQATRVMRHGYVAWGDGTQ